MPVPLARKSKLAFETVVAIMLSSMRITPLLNSAAYTIRQGFAPVPRSKVLPTSGVRSLVKSATTLIVSRVVSPIRILPPSVILPVTSTSPLTPKLPVTFVLANNSILPVPTVLISKLLFVAVVSILLPTICMSSVRNGPPTISPVTYNVPLTVALLLTVKLLVVIVPVTVSSPVIVNVPVSVGLAENTIFPVPVAPVAVTPSSIGWPPNTTAPVPLGVSVIFPFTPWAIVIVPLLVPELVFNSKL